MDKNTIKVLLVEDNPDDSFIVKEMMSDAKRAHFHIELKETLSSALSYLYENDIDVVLLDLTLPDSNGLQTYEKISTCAHSIPIVILSGMQIEELAVEAVKKGAQDYLIKGQITAIQLERFIIYAIERYNLYQQLAHANNKIKNELSVARKVQEKLYPSRIPHIDGLKVAAKIIQAREVGGDYYDIIQINDHELVLLIVDVTGHDIASAFIVGMAKFSFTTHIAACSSLVDVLNHVNADMFSIINDERFLSAFIAVIDSHTGTMKYAKAGHFKQCLYRASQNKNEMLHTNGMLIGAFQDGMFEEKTCSLCIGDKLILYTDGLFENTSIKGEQYGEKRLFESIKLHGNTPPNDMCNAILRQQREFCEYHPPEDDTCIIIVELTECSYSNDIEYIFKTDEPTLPPICLNDKESSKNGISQILTSMDSCKYPDPLIQQYKKTLHSIAVEFYANTGSTKSTLNCFVKIDRHKLKIALLVHSKSPDEIAFFSRDICRDILIQFNNTFGKIEINEQGDRLVFTLELDKKILVVENTGDISFASKEDGEYLTVPRNVSDSKNIETIKEEIIKKEIINADFQCIEKVINEKSGIPVRIGDTFKVYNNKKDSLYEISLDPLEASMCLVNLPDSGLRLDIHDLDYIMAKNRIVYGICRDTVNQIVNNPVQNKRYTIARGKPPVPGKDADIKTCIKITPSYKPLLKKDGSVDHKVLDLLVTISEGTVILQKYSKMNGVSGYSIFGRKIDPKQGTDKRIIIGENTELIDNGNKLIAKTDGYIFQEGDIIHVKHIFNIKGNVDYSTGNISYPGAVIIEGSIKAGFKVVAGKDICVHGEVEAAEIRSQKGNIDCKQGVIGKRKSVIDSGKSINADFIQETQIICKENLYVQKYILNVKCHVKGNVFLEDNNNGMIIGGKIRCRGSLYASEIGNSQQIRTEIIIEKNESSPIKQRVIQVNRKKSDIEGKVLSVKNEMQLKAKIFKIKTHKAVKEKNELESLLKEFYALKKELENIKLLLKFFKEKEQKEITFGKISVSKTIYPGVVIRFGNREKNIMSKMGPLIFEFEDGKILMKPFRERDDSKKV